MATFYDLEYKLVAQYLDNQEGTDVIVGYIKRLYNLWWAFDSSYYEYGGEVGCLSLGCLSLKDYIHGYIL